jgi:general secretion pathway protein E
VFVGEIRDRETAEIAVQAALTGHLVLSTLHTTSALGAPARLINMGVPDYLVAACLIGATAQRLARRLCPECAAETTLDAAGAGALGLEPGRAVRRAVGCDACFATGYAGRLPLVETCRVDDGLRAAIRDNPVEAELQRAAEAGATYRSMLRYGGELVAAGVTTVDEVLRVAN